MRPRRPRVPCMLLSGPPRPEQPKHVREHTALPWVLVGVGGAAVVAGVVLVATAPARPANCDPGSHSCSRIGNESDAALKQDQDQAGKADTQPVIGIVVAAVGGALVAGGLVWHLLEPTGPEDTSATRLRVQPWAGIDSGGVTLGGRF